MTRLFSTIAIMIAASVGGAQFFPDMDAIASAQQPEVGPTGVCQVNGILVDEPGILGGGGGPLQINSTFGAGVTPARQAVFQQAINEWQAVVRQAGRTPSPYNVTFQFGDLGCAGTLASTGVAVDFFSSDLRGATTTFNSNACVTFFVDPTPADDCEFTGGCPPPPVGSFDLLTVARHELGHGLGWVGTLSRRVDTFLVGNDFSPPRLNIATVSPGCGGFQSCHSDPAWLPNELMQPGVGARERRPIALYPSASMPARAFEYNIPMGFVDPTFPGTSFGTVTRPWTVFNDACFVGDVGLPLLLSNATHIVPAGGAPCTRAHVVHAARGGAVIRQP